jgi:hypothetical protein
VFAKLLDREINVIFASPRFPARGGGRSPKYFRMECERVEVAEQWFLSKLRLVIKTRPLDRSQTVAIKFPRAFLKGPSIIFQFEI